MNRSDRAPIYFIDTNVFVYSIGEDESFRNLCQRILVAAAEESIRAVTSTEVLQEIVHRYKAIRRDRLGIDLARQIMRAFRIVLPVYPEAINVMLDLVESHPHLSARDALHIAVARGAGIETIVTADRHFQDIPGVVAMHPLELAAQLSAETP